MLCIFGLSIMSISKAERTQTSLPLSPPPPDTPNFKDFFIPTTTAKSGKVGMAYEDVSGMWRREDVVDCLTFLAGDHCQSPGGERGKVHQEDRHVVSHYESRREEPEAAQRKHGGQGRGKLGWGKSSAKVCTPCQIPGEHQHPTLTAVCLGVWKAHLMHFLLSFQSNTIPLASMRGSQ
jgi:hypothetical protein